MSHPGHSTKTGSAGGSRIAVGRRPRDERDGYSFAEMRAALSEWSERRGLPQAPRSARSASVQNDKLTREAGAQNL